MFEYANIKLFSLADGIPSANQAKLSRHFFAGEFDNDFCILQDMDTIPLQREYFEDRTSHFIYGENNLLATGHEDYIGTVGEGKFPMSNPGPGMLGKTFNKIFNPNNDYVSALNSFCDLENTIDGKESINQNPHNFSDESLMRLLLKEHNDLNIIKVRRDTDNDKDRIDRSSWSIDVERLNRGEHFLCNALRPLDRHLKYFTPIFDYIFDGTYSKDDIILDVDWADWPRTDWNGPAY